MSGPSDRTELHALRMALAGACAAALAAGAVVGGLAAAHAGPFASAPAPTARAGGPGAGASALAPSPATPTPSSINGIDSCLAGRWTLTGAQRPGVTFTGWSGAILTIDPAARALRIDYTPSTTATISPGNGSLKLTGVATGVISGAQAGTLTLSSQDLSGLSGSAVVGGQAEPATGAQLGGLAGTPGPRTITYACTPAALSLTGAPGATDSYAR